MILNQWLPYTIYISISHQAYLAHQNSSTVYLGKLKNIKESFQGTKSML